MAWMFTWDDYLLLYRQYKIARKNMFLITLLIYKLKK